MTAQEIEYAKELIGRAEWDFDGTNGEFIAAIVRVVEQDILKLLAENAAHVDTFHSTGGGFVLMAGDEIAKGLYRTISSQDSK